MTKWEQRNDRNTKRPEAILQYLFKRFGMWPGCTATITPLAICEIPNDHATYLRQLPRLAQLQKNTINAVRAISSILKGKNRLVKIDLPGRSHRVYEIREASTNNPTRRLAWSQSMDKEIIRHMWECACCLPTKR